MTEYPIMPRPIVMRVRGLRLRNFLQHSVRAEDKQKRAPWMTYCHRDILIMPQPTEQNNPSEVLDLESRTNAEGKASGRHK